MTTHNQTPPNEQAGTAGDKAGGKPAANDPSPVRHSPWPYAIIAWFVLFIAGMATWAVVAVRQDMDLVRPDYYEEEIRYQKQIDRIENASVLRREVAIEHDAARHEVSVRLPGEHGEGAASGTVRFYRPSDARLDFDRPLAVDRDGIQRINAAGLQPGLWVVRVTWAAGGREYYVDRKIVL